VINYYKFTNKKDALLTNLGYLIVWNDQNMRFFPNFLGCKRLGDDKLRAGARMGMKNNSSA
jgi:hypothetical protein